MRMKLKIVSLLGSLTILCVLSASAFGQTNLTRCYGRIRTIAGSGAGGTDNVNYWKASFEGGFATNAALSRPHNAVADAAGNVFVVDKNSHAIVEITPDGRIHTVAGTHVAGFNGDGPAQGRTLQLNKPNGLYISGVGEMFVLDTGNGRVRCIQSNGVMSTLFSVVSGINIDRGLWVNDLKSEAVFCAGTQLMIWTRTGGVKLLNSKFTDLGNIFADTADSVIATDRGDNTVWEVAIHGAAAGTRTLLYGDGHKKQFADGTLAATSSLYGVRGVWRLPAGGNLLVTDEGCQMIYVDPAGVGHVWLDGQIGAHSGDGAWFYTPGYKISQARSVSVDTKGNILVVENDNGYVRRIEFMPTQGASGESPVFNPGNLAVERLGNGTETLAKTGNSVFIDQFETDGTFANTIAVPNTGGTALVLSGTASSEGGLTRSLDRTTLVLAGYNTDIGSISNSVPIPRAIASIDAFGKYQLVASSPDLYSGNNIRCGAGDGTNDFWTAGANGATYFVNPPNPPAAVQSTIANTRYVKVINGNLYFSTQSGTPGIYMMQGLPKSGDQTPVLLFTTGAKSQPAAFDINPARTLIYVADQNHGIQRWTNRAGVWAVEYTLAIKGGAFGVVADFKGAVPLVYATTGEASANRLVGFTDAGSSASARTLATAGKNQWFRGVDFVPDLTPTIVTQPVSQVVSKGASVTFNVAVSSLYPVSFQWRKNGVTISGATNASYTVSSVSQSAAYSVMVANTYSSLISSDALITLVEAVPPKVTITAPRANLVVSNNVLALRGTARDNVAVASVSYRVNASSWQVAHGTNSWTGQVTLDAGTNWVQAYATDSSGNSSLTASNKVIYVPVANLNVAVSGLGSVAGAVAAKTNASVKFAIGRPATLTATAAKGQAFLQWSGFTNGSDARIQFLMPGNDVDLTARFVPSPFPSATRLYKGLIVASDPFDLTNSGAFALTLSANGRYSVKLGFLSPAVSFSGQLGLYQGQTNVACASFPARVGGQNVQVAFQLMLGSPGLVSGTVTAAGTTNILAQINGGLLANTNLGRFNVAVSSTDTNSSPGYGYGWLTVSNAGVKVNLTLADDKAVITSLAADRLESGDIPVFAPLYGGKGFLSGWLTATNQQITSTSMVWRKAPGASATYYKGGFGQTVEIQGGAWRTVTNLAQWSRGDLVVDGQIISNGYADFTRGTNSKGTLLIPVSDGQHPAASWAITSATGLVKLNVAGVPGTGMLLTAPAVTPGIFGFTTNLLDGVGSVHSVNLAPSP